MSRNRVEELEATVAELESTVTGLTEELVEAKDRIRDLEAELEPDPADGSQFAGERAPEDGEDAQAAARSETAPEDHSPDGAFEASGEAPAGEADKGGATQEEDETESKPGDDIIVA